MAKNSIAVSWQAPDRPNGIILEYEIKYFEKVLTVQEDSKLYAIKRADVNKLDMGHFLHWYVGIDKKCIVTDRFSCNSLSWMMLINVFLDC